MAPPIHERRKRQWNQHSLQQQQHSQVEVNDLAIAATYAQMEAPTFSLAMTTASTTLASPSIKKDNEDSSADPAVNNNNDDDNEISLEDGGSSDDDDSFSPADSSQITPSSSSGAIGAVAVNEPEVEREGLQETCIAMNVPSVENDSNGGTLLNKDNVNNDDDDDEVDDNDDDESDVDLAEAVARMEQEDDDGDEDGGGDGSGSGGSNAPKTANEVDAYHVTVKQLEKVLGTSLSTKEWDEMHIKAKAAKLEPAGHVHYHLVDDRTIVVQSSMTGGVLLEEGNILVVKTSSSTTASSLKEEKGWMPLGKIFEVFGPVSRPFYSVRLPDPPERKSPPQVVKNIPEEKGTGTVLDAANSDQSACVSSDATKLASGDDDEDDDVDDDPWNANGKYTLLFRSSPKTLIYYLMDEATLINTNAVYQASGRGCDASNMHDEEVLNPKDMYYSDDEQEREATGKQRGRKPKGHSEHPQSRIRTGNNIIPNRSFGGGGGGGRGFIRPNDHGPYCPSPHVPGFHHHHHHHQHSSPAIEATAVSGFAQPPYPMMIANNNNNNNNMTLPPFNDRITGQVSASYSNNNAWHTGSMISQAGPQPSVPPPAEDTVYYDYS